MITSTVVCPALVSNKRKHQSWAWYEEVRGVQGSSHHNSRHQWWSTQSPFRAQMRGVGHLRQEGCLWFFSREGASWDLGLRMERGVLEIWWATQHWISQPLACGHLHSLNYFLPAAIFLCTGMLQVYTCIKVYVQSAYPIFGILGTPLNY